MMPYVESVSNPRRRTFSPRDPRSTSTIIDAPALRPRCATRATQLTTLRASVVASTSSKSVRQFPQLPQKAGASSPK